MNGGFAASPAAFAILGLFVIVSALALTSAPGIIQRNLLRPFRVVRDRDYLPVVTCGFIHADWGHLFFNGLTMYFFGPRLEQAMGTPRFIALYFVGLVLSSLGTVWKHRTDPNYASLGASGAILAVLFAYIVYFPTSRIAFLFIPVPIPAPLFACGYLAYTIWASKSRRDGVNHDAHLDGALTGLLFVAITDYHAWERAFERIFG
jgi:membrane associated rhomboid family serine protease